MADNRPVAIGEGASSTRRQGVRSVPRPGAAFSPSRPAAAGRAAGGACRSAGGRGLRCGSGGRESPCESTSLPVPGGGRIQPAEPPRRRGLPLSAPRRRRSCRPRRSNGRGRGRARAWPTGEPAVVGLRGVSRPVSGILEPLDRGDVSWFVGSSRSKTSGRRTGTLDAPRGRQRGSRPRRPHRNAFATGRYRRC